MTAGYPPYAPPRPSSRRTGVFSRESVLWRLDWILILAIAGLCFIGVPAHLFGDARQACSTPGSTR